MEAIALANTVLFSKALLVCLQFWNKKRFEEIICICECRGNIEQCVIMEVKGFWSWSQWHFSSEGLLKSVYFCSTDFSSLLALQCWLHLHLGTFVMPSYWKEERLSCSCQFLALVWHWLYSSLHYTLLFEGVFLFLPSSPILFFFKIGSHIVPS